MQKLLQENIGNQRCFFLFQARIRLEEYLILHRKNNTCGTKCMEICNPIKSIRDIMDQKFGSNQKQLVNPCPPGQRPKRAKIVHTCPNRKQRIVFCKLPTVLDDATLGEFEEYGFSCILPSLRNFSSFSTVQKLGDLSNFQDFSEEDVTPENHVGFRKPDGVVDDGVVYPLQELPDPPENFKSWGSTCPTQTMLELPDLSELIDDSDED